MVLGLNKVDTVKDKGALLPVLEGWGKRADLRAIVPLSAKRGTNVDRLVGDDHEVVTVIAGEGSSGEATAAIEAWLGDRRPGAVVEVHDGGQPLAAYLFSVE